MNKKRSIMFSLVRSAMAILIALGVAALLIFVSAEGDNLGEKFTQTLGALKQLLINPIFKAKGGISTKNISDILAGMIPIMFTGLATCVMFSANQFNMGAEGGIMLGAFVTGLVAVYAPVPGGLLPIVAILTCIVVCYIMKPKAIVEEVSASGKFKLKKLFCGMIYVAPVLLLVILAFAIFEAFGITFGGFLKF